MELTKEEKAAIATLKRLEKRWPKTLWIFAGGHRGLCILKTNDDGKRATTLNGGMDPDFEVANVDIPADGGDWD